MLGKLNLIKKLSYTQVIALGFLAVILIGSALLSLPVAARNGQSAPFVQALFTSTSATCVTGLIVADTFTAWSLFGQIVIITLIQIGGLGFMSVIAMFSMFLKRKIGLRERRLLMQSAGSLQIGGIVRLLRKILFGTLIFEGSGAVLLATRFCPDMGIGRGLYYAVFHSISAFCNAGFDIMGRYKQFSSFTAYADDPVVNITLVLLILIGGLGYIVWSDIVTHRLKFRMYSLHSKIVLAATAVLVGGGFLLMLLFESKNAFSGMSAGNKILAALFQSVSPRTAGMNTVDLNSLSDGGRILTDILMFIGGNPGSTAGGIKTTTFAVLILTAISAARHTNHVNVFKKRLEDDAVKQACAIFVIYTFTSIAAALAICTIEGIPSSQVIFEVVSAVGTVGLSLGITPTLSLASKIIIMILMYSGRVGGLTLMMSLAEKRAIVPLEKPAEKILIG